MHETIIHKLISWHEENPQANSHFLYNDQDYKNISIDLTINKIKAFSNYLRDNFPERSNIAIILATDNTYDFYIFFLATLAANMVAVPIAPPDNHDKHNLSNKRISRILRQIDAKLLISNRPICEKLADAKLILPIKKFLTENIGDLKESEYTLPNINIHEAAFLQYTSGTTGKVKGVMITHANIIANISAMAQRLTENNIQIKHVVNWLPHYHDMGLISGLLLPIFLNVPTVLIPTKKFIMEPMLWLKTISKFKHTLSGGPDFAYSLCIRNARRGIPEDLDLSNWEIAFTGAQMVQPDTFLKFKNTFAACGFRENRFYPCYGLAEATLYVTGGNLELQPKIKEVADNKVFSVGSVLENHTLLIVDPECKAILPDGEVGEIWVKGESVAAGYYMNPVATCETFDAETKDHKKYFLRTGDLGILEDGELYVVGRLKDMVIVHGKNYPCTDLEWAAVQSHEALRENHCAAFSTQKNNKNICVIVAEIHPQFKNAQEDIQRSIREAISDKLGIKVHEIILTEPRTLAKTSSGKLRRFQIKCDFLDGKFQE